MARHVGQRGVNSIVDVLYLKRSAGVRRHADTVPGRAGTPSITAETTLASAETATAALILIGPAAHAATHLAREGIAGSEHVLRRGECGAWRRTTGRRTIPAASSAARGALWPILGAVHPQAPSPQVVAVELTNRVGSFGIGGELGEGKTTRAAGFAIGTDVNAGNLTRLRQQRGELVLRSIKAQIADEDFVRNDRLLLVGVWSRAGAFSLV